MFTGLVEAQGVICSLAPWTIQVSGDLPPTELGDSIAINGCCLSVVHLHTDRDNSLLTFDLSPETLRKTNLGSSALGDSVNLEWALKVGARLGGHWVTGHIDTTARVIEITTLGDFVRMQIEIPAAYQNHFVNKGSIAVDGVSLTVNQAFGDRFEVMIIPQTLHRTTMGQYRVGQTVNLETDILGKYALRAVEKAQYENI